MRWTKHDKQLMALARELMESEGLTEVEAVKQARALLLSLRRFTRQWNANARQVKQQQEAQHERT